MKKEYLIALCAFYIALVLSVCSAQECSSLKGAKTEELVSYLEKDRAAIDPGCGVYALTELGNRKHVAAVELLSQYLDFRRSPMPAEREGARPSMPFDLYPAAISLFVIGPPATPVLLRLIGEPTTPSIVWVNAIETLRSIYREQPSAAVSRLRAASKQAQNPVESDLLFRAAEGLASRCLPDQRTQCEQALRK